MKTLRVPRWILRELPGRADLRTFVVEVRAGTSKERLLLDWSPELVRWYSERLEIEEQEVDLIPSIYDSIVEGKRDRLRLAGGLIVGLVALILAIPLIQMTPYLFKSGSDGTAEVFGILFVVFALVLWTAPLPIAVLLVVFGLPMVMETRTAGFVGGLMVIHAVGWSLLAWSRGRSGWSGFLGAGVLCLGER